MQIHRARMNVCTNRARSSSCSNWGHSYRPTRSVDDASILLVTYVYCRVSISHRSLWIEWCRRPPQIIIPHPRSAKTLAERFYFLSFRQCANIMCIHRRRQCHNRLRMMHCVCQFGRSEYIQYLFVSIFLNKHTGMNMCSV